VSAVVGLFWILLPLIIMMCSFLVRSRKKGKKKEIDDGLSCVVVSITQENFRPFSNRGPTTFLMYVINGTILKVHRPNK
jgi:hypothetical protein